MSIPITSEALKLRFVFGPFSCVPFLMENIMNALIVHFDALCKSAALHSIFEANIGRDHQRPTSQQQLTEPLNGQQQWNGHIPANGQQPTNNQQVADNLQPVAQQVAPQNYKPSLDSSVTVTEPLLSAASNLPSSADNIDLDTSFDDWGEWRPARDKGRPFESSKYSTLTLTKSLSLSYSLCLAILHTGTSNLRSNCSPCLSVCLTLSLRLFLERRPGQVADGLDLLN
ncbi:hypothetical protein E3N88_36031 [Mikania micrantha]|uniref:Uncharacterized protein n=1 Tax=Mikania micrantha TaxID=192012 RepID=A0A5N6M357_9ASTR|nr:hypothetical protein E3N88_36031 [Mikania micrantha]